MLNTIAVLETVGLHVIIRILTKSLKFHTFHRSSTEAIYENSLDVVIKHAREVEQKKKKKKKRENSMRRRVRPGT